MCYWSTTGGGIASATPGSGPTVTSLSQSSSETDVVSQPVLEALSKTSVEAYQRYRQYIEHENLLVNFRTTWAIGANSFLLLAYGTTLTSANGPHPQFLAALAIVGIFVNAASWVSVEAAFSALHAIKTRWEELTIRHPLLPPITGAGKTWIIRWGHFGSRFLLLALAVIWLSLLIYTLTDKAPAKASVETLLGQIVDILKNPTAAPRP